MVLSFSGNKIEMRTVEMVLVFVFGAIRQLPNGVSAIEMNLASTVLLVND